MNEELIEKLSYEARNYAHEQNDLYGVSYIQTFELKFAELIVRECSHIAWLYDEPKLSGPGAMISKMIENHFGVEE